MKYATSWWFCDGLKAPKEEREVYLYTEDVEVAKTLRRKVGQAGLYYTTESSRPRAWQFRMRWYDHWPMLSELPQLQ